MTSGDFGWTGFRFGWLGAMDSGMVDRDGDATVREYVQKTKLERRRKEEKEAAEAEKIRAEEEAAQKAENERLVFEEEQRIKRSTGLYWRAMGREPPPSK